MKIKHSNCLVCKSEKLSPSIRCKDNFVSGEDFTIDKCDSCGFLFTQNIPSAETMAPYYHSEEYISHSNTQNGLVNKLYHSVRNIMLARKLKLIRNLTPGKALLDIGCGTGYFPYYMKSKGFDAKGMELEPEARKFAADNFNLDVSSPEELLNQTIKNKYDVITLWHVMEHLHDTEKYLNWIYQSLKSDGVLIIALPNCSSYDAKHFKENWAAYDVPRHLWHFIPENFEKYTSQFNFELKKVKRLPFDAYYNSLMSAKYRGDKIALLSGFIIGYISNLKSLFCPKKTSSVIYILKKK